MSEISEVEPTSSFLSSQPSVLNESSVISTLNSNENLVENGISYCEAVLPREILELVFSFLDISQLYPLQFVNKRWKTVVRNHFKSSRTTEWQWSKIRKDPSIEIDGLIVRRPSNEGKNPGVSVVQPLTRQTCHFRVEILKFGKWFGIGVADSNYEMHGKTLGTQPTGCNSAYFWQDNGISRLQMQGEENIDADQITSSKVILDVRVDFDLKLVSYWLNGRYQGTLTCTKYPFKEGGLYPCANLSSGTVLRLCNGEIPCLDVQPEEEESDDEPFEVPAAPFPTQWEWDSSPLKKASVVELDNENLMATRKSGGHNPAVMTVTPFTRNSCYFQVKIHQASKWLGIGLADKRLRLNGSRTLGNQRKGFNSSYFWQQNRSHNLQTYGEKTKPVSPLANGDIVGVRVDFDNQCIYYYLNGIFEGKVECTKRKMKEGHVYPCIDLSIGSQVMIMNVNSFPHLDIRTDNSKKK